ncbi:MAG: ComE operon protein 3 [SAR116 cluster bacterium MED-G04]|nr:MAG: ComE operon protein 3 [SAR116 cluster bacterium MED-G04]
MKSLWPTTTNTTPRPSEVSLRVVTMVMAGIMVEDVMAESMGGVMIAAAIGIIWLMAGVCCWRFSEQLKALGMTMLMLLPFAALGFAMASFTGGPQKELHPPGVMTATGTVAMAEAMTRSRQRIRFTPDGVGSKGTNVGGTNVGGANVKGDWRLIVPAEAASLSPGDRVTLTARLQHPLPRLLPGGFDFTAHALRHGFSATGFVREVEVTGQGDASTIAVMRYHLQQRIIAALPEEKAAVASALLVGLRGLITPGLREDFRASGLAHLLAISGLHMALFCGSVLFAIRLVLALFPVFSSRYPALKIAALASLPFGAFYLMVAGMPISAMRAFGMVCFVILAIVLDRRGMTLHHVAMMALILLLIDPDSLYDPAFQMSFAAVFAQVASWMIRQQYRITTVTTNPPGPGRKLMRYGGEIAAASLIASSASAPFVLYHFGVTTAWSVLANLAGMLLMGFIIMPAGVLAFLLMPLGLEPSAFFLMGQGIDPLTTVAARIAEFPLSSLHLPSPPAITLVLLTLAMVVPFMIRAVRVFIIPLLITGGLVCWIIQPLPQLAITNLHGRIYAVVINSDGEAVISRRKTNGFTRSVLLRPFGFATAQYAPDADGSECRRGYCLIPVKGTGQSPGEDKRIALVWRRFALTDACREADLVLAHVDALYPCSDGTAIIDPAGISTSGGILGYSDEAGFRLESVNKDG